MSTTPFSLAIKRIETILDDLKRLNPDNVAICDEIQDYLENLDSLYEDIQTDLENITEEKSTLYYEVFEPYDSLKSSVERYNSGVKSEQETILKILEDEFNLSLVCL